VFVSSESRYYQIHRLNKGTIDASKLYHQLLQLAQQFPTDLQATNIEERIKSTLEAYDLVFDGNVPDFIFAFFDHILKKKSISLTFNSDYVNKINRHTWLRLLENLDRLILCEFIFENENQVMNYAIKFNNQIEGVIDLKNDEVRIKILDQN